MQQNLGIPINRYMEVDFVTFAGLVDAVGGVNIDFPYPAFDTQSGLDIKQTGASKLNGEQALAYVRSRHYTEIKEDGKPHEDPTADLGRVGSPAGLHARRDVEGRQLAEPDHAAEGERQDHRRASASTTSSASSAPSGWPGT